MYETEYGTDWDEVDTAAAIERAYALGVAATLGETHPGELDRLQAVADTAHDRAIVKLAYDRGRNRGAKAAGGNDDNEEIWNHLVSDTETEPVSVRRDRDLPAALKSLPMLEPPGDGLDRVRLPRFLLRR